MRKEQHANIALFIPHNGCPHQCAFCNQRTISGAQEQPSAQDVRAAVRTAMASSQFDGTRAEIAFFGGSFTAIERGYMLTLLEAAYAFVRSGDVAGIRISTRPDAIDADVLNILQAHGVTAIELGAQSMRDEVLRLNRRGHTAQDVTDAARLIKAYGFSLGLQMMTGLYGDDDAGAVETAHRLADLQPDTMRIYPTVVLAGTELAERMRAGTYRPQDVEEAAALCAGLLTFFESRGIRVIKLGLHASDGVAGECVGGAYHPAFRELCEGKLYEQMMRRLLSEQYPNGGDFIVYVDSREVSKAIGQRRCNVAALAADGWHVTVKGVKFEHGEEGRICQIEPLPQPDSQAQSQENRH